MNEDINEFLRGVTAPFLKEIADQEQSDQGWTTLGRGFACMYQGMLAAVPSQDIAMSAFMLTVTAFLKSGPSAS